MLLGKRPRPSMARTTSMSQFSPDDVISTTDDVTGCRSGRHRPSPFAGEVPVIPGYLGSMLSPRGAGGQPGRSSGDVGFVETAGFLRACGLCGRALGPGRDAFMYRGDIAFCSFECRQQQMNVDERKEKCSLTSMKDTSPPSVSEKSGGDGHVVAA